MYDSIVVVQHFTSIRYNNNAGKILFIAPDDLFDLWSLFLLSPYHHNSNFDIHIIYIC